MIRRGFGRRTMDWVQWVGVGIFIMLVIAIISIAVYGVVLSFQASIILGVIVLIVEPSPFIIGLVALCGTNIPMAIQNWIHFPI